MKNQFCTLLLAFILMGSFAKAQSNENWQPVALTAGGATNANGIEATYELASSGGHDVVIVKLVNHNTYAVKATWKDLIITKNGQNLSGNNTQESVTIAPKIRASDDLGNTVQVTVKLSDFQTNATNFKSFDVSNFDVLSVQ